MEYVVDEAFMMEGPLIKKLRHWLQLQREDDVEISEEDSDRGGSHFG